MDFVICTSGSFSCLPQVPCSCNSVEEVEKNKLAVKNLTTPVGMEHKNRYITSPLESLAVKESIKNRRRGGQKTRFERVTGVVGTLVCLSGSDQMARKNIKKAQEKDDEEWGNRFFCLWF